LPAKEGSADLRSIERLRYSCSNSLGKRDITLFANGTVRLREGPHDAQRMSLTELDPEALASQLRVLRGLRRDAQEHRYDVPLAPPLEGSLVERCTLRLELPGEEPVEASADPLETLPLWVSRAIHVAERLAEQVRPLDSPERLPRGYSPRPGDVLRNGEGKIYRVVSLTSDGRGVELEARDEPIRIFVALSEIRGVFVAIEGRDGL
jgi:hypothetical protein